MKKKIYTINNRCTIICNSSISNYLRNTNNSKTIIFNFLLFFFISPCFLSTKEFIPDKIHKDTIPVYNYGTIWHSGIIYYPGDGVEYKDYKEYTIPTQMGLEYKWLEISSGYGNRHFMALKSDSTLWCWGRNIYGEIGDGTTNKILSPLNIMGKKKWNCINSAFSSSLAIATDGLLWSWGNNYEGLLGDSTNIDKLIPEPICDKEEVPFVSLYHYSYGSQFAIRADGTLWGWGGSWNKYDTAKGKSTFFYYHAEYYPVKIGKSNDWLFCMGAKLYDSGIADDDPFSPCISYVANTAGKIFQIGEKHTYSKPDSSFILKETKYNTSVWKEISIEQKTKYGIKQDGSIWKWGLRYPPEYDENRKNIYDSIPQQIGNDYDWSEIISFYRQYLKKDGTVWDIKYLKKWDSEKKDSVFYATFLKNEYLANVIKFTTGYYSSYNSRSYIVRHIPTQPDVEIRELSQLTDSMAIFRAEVLSDGKEYDAIRGICYSLQLNPTIESDTARHGIGKGEYLGTIKYLKPKTRYYCRAFVTNSLGTAYSDEVTIYTKLNKPILISPQDGTYNQPQNIALEWEKVPNALTYRITIADNPDFITPFAEIDTDELFSKDMNFQPLTEYYWKVQAWQGVDSSDWSDTWSFSTSKYLVQKLEFPPNDSINIPIDCTIQWNKNIPLSKYQIQISEKSVFNSLYLDTLLSENFLKCKNLKYLQSYYWRLRAKEGNDESDWSDTWKFTTLMDSVNLSSPKLSVINLPVKTEFVYEPGIYKRNYRIQISSSNDFEIVDIDKLVNSFSTEIDNLNYFTKYYWRVRNESGDTLGYWSQRWNFQTAMSGLYLIYPENDRTNVDCNVDFRWSDVIGSSFYHLQVSKNNTFTDLIFSKDSITKSTQIVKDLEINTKYYWRARAWNGIGSPTANWSDTWKFITSTSDINETLHKIQISPNPLKSKNSLNIVFNSDKTYNEVKISILDLSGRIIDESTSFGGELNLQYLPESDLTPGTYFIVISSNGEVLGREKFIVVE